MDLSAAAKEARRAYHRAYYAKNRERILAQRRERYEEGRDAVREAERRHWEKVARERGGGDGDDAR